MTHTYKLKYSLSTEPGEFAAGDVGDSGATDALVVISCLYPEDGSYSQNFWSFDGRKNGDALSANDLFKMWMMLGETLARNGDVVGRNAVALDEAVLAVRRVVFGEN